MHAPFRSKARKKKKSSPLLSAARWVAALFGVVYLSWCVFFPSSSGAVGRTVSAAVFQALGAASYLVPPLLAYGLILYFTAEKASGYLTWAAGAALTTLSAATVLSAVGSLDDRARWGGAVGESFLARLQDTVGSAGGWFVAVALGLAGLQVLFEIRWSKALSALARLVARDYRDWMRARKELTGQIRAAADTARPLILQVPAGGDLSAAVPAPSPAAPPAPIIEEPEPLTRPSDTLSRQAGEGRARVSAGDFRLPPLELLSPKKGDHGGKPTQAEIDESVRSLETTLASFEIEARVGGISPGPVITRYEVSPAPGVTVSSIVARADDIALATKAKGLRMIAPIPGKAAIGIEIPNHRPASVTLREVLESPTMTHHRSPLAFALGLSSDGTPLAADLQTMPHLLVAGATNSGKSVLVHSLVQTILFRSRPDEVKFLLIDPKRIELSLYEGIPHLYDPKVPAQQVGVVTHSKEASRSLKALVTVMEHRYEKFQEYRARDIDAFNREADSRGEQRMFYIVVVIDELADLMVVSRDVVEDSIQRLAQMARAVGIHLVLATQRPSVDVITGVIKANLPSRIALRVASKVDSKVILDAVGAEALLGKGDMLYMIPGQDPSRVQGCFVSTEEIGRVVDHLKTQGKADYPPMATMSSAGAADLADFGVEPLEFTQALKLVLERRRVSQDLLKSQFGSSARATNLLSLLEVKGFIHKPEGSNRWEIHFDQIEDFLRTNYPQVRLDKPGI